MAIGRSSLKAGQTEDKLLAATPHINTCIHTPEKEIVDRPPPYIRLALWAN